MLQLKEIKKQYAEGENAVMALKGISLQFRKSDFVSILGPSGCGKTTMLNIIGGLDQYTEGDLVINGRSTKDFNDRDWDAYRNHAIGFVFQSYNLIPHQTVLQNVELALTISGVSKAERRARAKKALEEVGLGDQLKKRPGEMSGGQMQRVAIARALVNNPDILLADEPTGALDTETSVQVMEILKKVAEDRLVIMVTHNPDLAERYSTRIIRMLDGRITDDSAPLTEEEIAAAKEAEQPAGKKKKEKMPSMSFGTAFGLSLKNLFTKKGRTILTAFAGSIGIIGIALISAVSTGTNNYINRVQEDTLSSYPLTIEATTIDLGTLMQTFMGVAKDSENQHENDAVYSKSVMYDMINAFNNLEATENDLRSFKTYIEDRRRDEEAPLHDALTGVKYTYDMDLLVYTKSVDNTIIRSDTRQMLSDMISSYYDMDMSAMMGASPMMSMGQSNSVGLWEEMLPGDNGALINPVLETQYEVVYGSWPNSYNEIVLVLDEHNELDDLTLYALGLESEEEVQKIFDAVMSQETIETEMKTWSYEDICKMDFHVILGADCFTYDEMSGTYLDLRENETGLLYLYDNGLTLKVTGILRPSEDATSSMLQGSIGYTTALTEYVANHVKDAPALKAQLSDETSDVFTGLPFKPAESLTDEEKAAAFRARVEDMDEAEKAKTYIAIMSTPSKEQVQAAVDQTIGSMTREDMENTLIQGMTSQMSMSEEDIRGYLAGMEDQEIIDLFAKSIEEQMKAQMAAQVQAQLGSLSEAELAGMLTMAMPSYTDEQCIAYYDQVLEFSETSYEDNLRTLGFVDLDDPASINLYAATFADKDVIEEAIAKYNDGVEELSRIHYTDYVGLLMSSVTTVINAITYVLIAFVAISLVVSSIMIGVITLISVQERTKEIGILRAIGASKRDVSSMFNAETIIIGFAAGLLGVLVTYLLCIPVNLIIHALTDIPNLSAYLSPVVAVALVIISVLLTLVAGIIPSRSAAKKDPVVALRTE